MDSVENDLAFSDDDEELYYSSGDDADMKGVEDDSYKEKHFKILNETDIRQRQNNDISTVSGLLSVSREVACMLLLEKNWDLTSFNDDWFVAKDEIAVEPVGLLGKQKVIKQACDICFEEINDENTVSVACGHPFCVVCFKTYIITWINDGPGCLTLRCPMPNCGAFVGLNMVDRLVSGDDRDKYYEYLYRSYVELSRIRKWCPAPGCNLAVEFEHTIDESYDVMCHCFYKFCWKCTEESHRPINCETVAKWAEKNCSEAENTTWIMAYTKPCPRCKRPIEKNQGCNHMTCRSPCNHSFCWICLRSWADHGNMACNRFADEFDMDANNRMMAKKHMEKYTHFYVRWYSNDKSKKKALVDLDMVKTNHVDMLCKLQGQPQFGFLINAWEQIVECRRILKWTYAYGYYLSLDDSSSNKMNLFECLQGEAEAALEKLHYCAEKEIEKYLKARQEDFEDFHTKLVNFTRVTRNYFENLIKALENNLSEVNT